MSNIIPVKEFSRKDKSGKNTRRYGVFLCKSCGDEFESRLERVNRMTGLCLPCANIEGGKKRVTHGLNNRNSRLHVTWSNMKRRCVNPQGKEKRIYADVSLCEEWMDFEPFMKWAIANGYTDKATIDRKNGCGNYEPANCRFVDYSTQSANRKKSNKNRTGFIGVFEEPGGKFSAKVQWKRKQHNLGRFHNKKDASIARDLYVLDNGLPHTLNHTIDDLKEIKAIYNKKARELEKLNGQ